MLNIEVKNINMIKNVGEDYNLLIVNNIDNNNTIKIINTSTIIKTFELKILNIEYDILINNSKTEKIKNIILNPNDFININILNIKTNNYILIKKIIGETYFNFKKDINYKFDNDNMDSIVYVLIISNINEIYSKYINVINKIPNYIFMIDGDTKTKYDIKNKILFIKNNTDKFKVLKKILLFRYIYIFNDKISKIKLDINNENILKLCRKEILNFNKIYKNEDKYKKFKDNQYFFEKKIQLIFKNKYYSKEISSYKEVINDIPQIEENFNNKDIFEDKLNDISQIKEIIDNEDIFEDKLINDYYYKFNNISEINQINIDDIITINKNYFNTIEIDEDVLYKNHIIRNFTSFDHIKENFKENPYYIYNKKTFYELYKDFDYEFYKNKYFKDTNKSEFDILLYYHQYGRKLKHIINNNITIIVYSLILNNNCGGIIVMHNLVKIINDLKINNIKAKLFNPYNIRYNNIFSNEFADINDINENTIVIYPEIICGNPLNASKVIRWILLDLGIEMPLNHYKIWNKNDLIYFWEPKITDNIYFKQLACPWYNPIYKNYNKNERVNSCYLIKKAKLIHKNEIKNIHPENSILIDDYKNHLNVNYTDEIINIFNNCKYLYSYDPNSAFIIFAAICGCIPIVYPIENVSKIEYLSNRMMNCGGELIDFIAYGDDPNELIHAENQMQKIDYHINKINNYYLQNTIKNIKELINYNLLTNKVETYYNELNSRNNFFKNITNEEINNYHCYLKNIINELKTTTLEEFNLLKHINIINNDISYDQLLKLYHGDKVSQPNYNNLYLSWFIDCIKNRKISIISPITNTIIYTDKYFITNNLDNENTLYSICNYYFDNEEILVGLGLGTGNHPQEAHIVYVYCIRENNLMYDWINYPIQYFKNRLFVKVLYIFNNIIKKHNFDNMDNKISTIYGYMYNMAHQLFNDYTGLYLIDYNNIAINIDEIIFGNHDVYYIKNYFKKFKNINIIDNDNIKNIEKIGRGVFFKYNANYILDNTISFLKNNLIADVNNNIYKDFNYEYEKINADFIKKKYYPIFNIVLRNGSYTMVDQEITISKLINLLIEKYPNAFFYLDGFIKNSNDVNFFIEVDHSKKINDICYNYLETSDKIIKNVNTKNIKSLINTNILHLITHIENCDYGIYILGSAACNSVWICKIPGIQFGRSKIKIYEHMDKLIRENTPDINYYDDNITYNDDNSFIINEKTIFDLIPDFLPKNLAHTLINRKNKIDKTNLMFY